MALAPCHAFFQFIVEPLTMDQRVELYTEKKYPERLYQYQEDMDPILSQLAPHRGEDLPDSIKEIVDVMLAENEIPDKRLNCVLTQRKLNCAIAA